MRSRVWTAAVLCSLFVVTTACSKNSNDGNTSGASGEPIKVWMINPLTRANSLTPSMPAAAKAAAKAINDQGGIKGRPIEITSCDDQGDPNVAARCARDAVDGGAVAVVGTLDADAESTGYLPILEAAGIPIVGGHPINGADLTSKIMFPTDGGTPVTLAGEAAAAAALGAKKPAFTGQDSPQWTAILGWLQSGLNPSGATLNQNVRVPGGTPDMAPYASKVLADGSDAVMNAFGQADFVNMVKAIRGSGSNVPILTIGATSTNPAAIAALGPYAEGIGSVSLCKPAAMTGDPDVDKFTKTLNDYDPSAAKDDFAGVAYVSVNLFAHVASTLDTIDAPSMLAAMPKVTGFDTGVCGVVSYDKPLAQFPDLPRLFRSTVIYTHIKDGKLQPVTGEFVEPF